MSAIARSAANLVTTSGVWLKGGVNNDSFDNVTALPSSLADGITLISSQTASSSASISFTSGITSTYKAYKFVFVNIHASTTAKFSFNGSSDSGSNYNVTKTTTVFNAYHYESDVAQNLNYDDANSDIAQGTGFQSLTQYDQNADNDSGTSGTLIIFNPSSTTYVKHFISNSNMMGAGSYQSNSYVAGYFNTTSAINAVRFQMSSGNIDAGTIYMYGIK